LYQNGDFEGAIRALRAAVEELEKLPDSTEAFDQWTRAMMLLARSHQTIGNRGDAAVVIERLVRAAPEIKVDAKQYPPSFRKQIEDAKARLGAVPKRKLTVESPTDGVQIFVDGRDVGTSPVTVFVDPGQHRVSGRLGEVRIPRFGVDLGSEDQTVVVNVEVPASFRPSSGPGLALPADDRQKTLIVAATLLGLDKLVAGSFLLDGDVTYLAGACYDVRKGMLIREGRVRLANRRPPPNGISDLAKFLVTGQLEASVEVPGKPPPEAALPLPPGPPAAEIAREPSSSTRSWIAFGAGVVGVGLGAFGIAEGLSAKSSYNDAHSLLDGDALKIGADPAKYNQAVAAADSAKTRAWIAGGLAVGALAVGGVLGYLSYKETKQVGPLRF
jgi:hypothetical protein